MNKQRWIPVAVACAVLACSIPVFSFAANAEASSGLNGDVASGWITYNTEHIEGTRRISAVTGKWATTDTQTLFDVGGTDLGIPFTYRYTDTDGNEKEELRVLFGDTFSNEFLIGNWRSNVMGISTDTDFSDGLTFDSFVSTAGNGFATEIIPGIHVSQQQMTAIPTGAMQIGDAVYVYYMGVRVWGDDGEWWNNLGGVYKSTDGQNYERVESMYIYANTMKNFTQNFPLVVDEDHDGTDDYVYVYGISGGRSAGTRCMRVSLKGENGEVLSDIEQQTRVEDLNNYEYFNGFDESGNPAWIAYNEYYMALVWNYSEEAEVITAPCGEMSVCYNPYLGQYMATYQQHNTLIMRLADHPWGPFGKTEIILTSSDFNTFYNAFTTQAMLKDGGKTVYFLMSQWPRDENNATLNYFVGLMEMKLK